MALDRQSIEKRDFPIGRRGYDPDAVDAHLSQVADEVDELKVSSRRHTETLATTAGDQVKAIVEAAEAGAGEIKRQAEEDARAVRSEAAADAHATRDGASAQAHDYVSRVSEATAAMLQRINAMEAELTSLVDSLKTGANRLNADLQLLEGSFTQVRSSASPRGQIDDPETAAPAGAATVAGVDGAGAGGAAGADVDSDGSTSAGGSADDAKLIALNMALNGTARGETDSYLADNFPGVDRAALLDEVYDSTAG